MHEMTREGLARELAKIAIAVEQNAVEGVFIVAVHANGTSSEILVSPNSKLHVEKLMLAIDRMHFRSKVACYLGPKHVGAGMPPVSDEKQ